MKKYILALVSAAVAINACTQYPTGALYDLATTHEGFTSKRVSSHDKNGLNADNIRIEPGEAKTIFDVSGTGIINHIWFTIAPPPETLNRNNVIIRCYWDGNDYPSVESPIGPFFGQGWDENYTFTSYAIFAGPQTGTALSTYFKMPFSKGAKIEIENQNDNAIDALFYYVDYYEMKKLPSNAGRFHAWYNRQETVPESPIEGESVGKEIPNLNGKGNYVFADIKGKGCFVGVNYYVQNPYWYWYGEGDDMWFVDGETEPSIIGTGTEDFFNTSWGPRTYYTNPFFGYARVNEGEEWRGRTHLYRFFITDPVCFNSSLKVTIEHGTSNNFALDLASVAYWYQDKPYPVPRIPDKQAREVKPFRQL